MFVSLYVFKSPPPIRGSEAPPRGSPLQTNHSVLLVGYGVDNGVEYWHVMNSWSTKWGDKGFVKIKKGDNIMSIGSMGEAATVEINEIVKHK